MLANGSLSAELPVACDNDKGGSPRLASPRPNNRPYSFRKYNYGVAYRRYPGIRRVITRTAELNTCGVVNSPFSRPAIDRSINPKGPRGNQPAPVIPNRQYVHTHHRLSITSLHIYTYIHTHIQPGLLSLSLSLTPPRIKNSSFLLFPFDQGNQARYHPPPFSFPIKLKNNGGIN